MDMTSKQQTALAAGALTIGAALLARGLRTARAIDFRGRSVLITGGSRGLGLLIARELGGQGARMTIAARDRAELERAREDLIARGIDVDIVPCDIRHRDEAEQLVQQVITRTSTIDVLINNAGVIQVGPFEHMDIADFEDAMNVHFWGPLHTMRAAIPSMRRQGGGRIVNISSIGGKIGVPHLAPYCASKFALTGLSASLNAELAKDRIYVTTVCPGMMRTGSPFNAWFKGRHRDEFTWFAISDSAPVLSIAGARAASQIVDACRKGGIVSIPGVYGGFLDKIPFGAAFQKGLTFKMGQTHMMRYMRPLLELIERGLIDPSFVITHRLPLDQAPEAYKTFRDKKDGCIKVVLKPHGVTVH